MSSVKPNVGAVLDLDGVQLPLRWDFGAVAVFEDLSGSALGPEFKIGVRHLLFMLYAAISAHARWRKTEVPIGIDELGSLLDSQEKVDRAVSTVNELVAAFQGSDMRTPAESGKEQDPGSQTKTATGSNGLTSSAPSTLASPKTSSGDSPSSSSTPGPNATPS